MPIRNGKLPKQVLCSSYCWPGGWKRSLVSPLNAQSTCQCPTTLPLQALLGCLSILTDQICAANQCTTKTQFSLGYSIDVYEVEVRGQSRVQGVQLFSVSATSTMGGRNRLCTPQAAQEEAVIAPERPGCCTAEGSKQGIDQLLLYYTCNHGFLHASF